MLHEDIFVMMMMMMMMMMMVLIKVLGMRKHECLEHFINMNVLHLLKGMF